MFKFVCLNSYLEREIILFRKRNYRINNLVILFLEEKNHVKSFDFIL